MLRAEALWAGTREDGLPPFRIEHDDLSSCGWDTLGFHPAEFPHERMKLRTLLPYPLGMGPDGLGSEDGAFAKHPLGLRPLALSLMIYCRADMEWISGLLGGVRRFSALSL